MKKIVGRAGVAVAIASAALGDVSNGGFETGDFSDWILEYGTIIWTQSCSRTVAWGSVYPPGHHSPAVISESSAPANGQTIDVNPYCGIYSARINGLGGGQDATRLRQAFVVSESEACPLPNARHVNVTWGAILEHDATHCPTDNTPQAEVSIEILVNASSVSLTQIDAAAAAAPGSGWTLVGAVPGGNAWYKTSTLSVPFSAAAGDTVEVILSACDCSGGGHGGMAFIDCVSLSCGPVPPFTCVPAACPTWDTTIGIPGLGSEPSVLAVLDLDGLGPTWPALFAGGDFVPPVGETTRCIASWDGSSWSGFGPPAGAGGLGNGIDEYVNVIDLAVYNGELYAAGIFMTPATGIAKFSINQNSWVTVGGGLDGPAYALEVYQNRLYVGGDFSSAGGVPARHIASWDGIAQVWSAVGAGFAGFNAPVRALAVGPGIPGPALYAGGEFDGLEGGPTGTHKHVARLNGSSWEAVDGGTNGTVRTFAFHKSYDSQINIFFFAGGDFTTAGTQPCDHVAGLGFPPGAFQWPPTWHPVGTATAQGTNGTVYALASVDPCGPEGPLLIAGGSFSEAGGSPAANIARFDGDSWLPMGAGADASVSALAIYDDGEGFALVAGGSFTTVDGQASACVATRKPCGNCCGGKRRPRFLDAIWPNSTTVAACTTFSLAPSALALQIIDLSDQLSAPIGGPPGWVPPFYSEAPDWTMSQLGEVYGVALDDAGNVYAAHSTVLGHPSVAGDVVGSSGLRGVIYRIPTMGEADELEFAVLPNFPDPSFPPSQVAESYPGLGDLAWDCEHHRLFVSNFEDGKIYALSPESPEPVDIYDHGIPDDGAPGFVPLGERVWGLESKENRLYYGLMWHHFGSPPNHLQEIWSVGLGVEGRFLPGTARREIELSSPYPPAGLTFGPNGTLFVATLGTIGDSHTGFGGSLTEYRLQGGVWMPTGSDPFTHFSDGTMGGIDCDWNPTPPTRMWTSAIIVNEGGPPPQTHIDGLLGLPLVGGAVATGVWIDLDLDPNNVTRGAMDVVVSCPAPPPWVEGSPTMRIGCIPGIEGVIGCPCSNPPVDPGLGCNNFGAGPGPSGLLQGSGVASVGDDSVVLSSSGENNTSMSVFWGGSGTLHPTGVVSAAGVRCVTTALKRFYIGNASGGALSRPGGTDPSITARATAVGAPISAGQTRHFYVAYRDPQAAGACGSTSATINVTNAFSITWSR